MPVGPVLFPARCPPVKPRQGYVAACYCQAQRAVAEPCLPVSLVMLIRVNLSHRAVGFRERHKKGDLSEIARLGTRGCDSHKVFAGGRGGGRD